MVGILSDSKLSIKIFTGVMTTVIVNLPANGVDEMSAGYIP